MQVGVLIGKAGDTIRYMQLNSGARIQITRDADADPNAPTRPVELIGSLENINKAERLIKDVIAEVGYAVSNELFIYLVFYELYFVLVLIYRNPPAALFKAEFILL